MLVDRRTKYINRTKPNGVKVISASQPTDAVLLARAHLSLVAGSCVGEQADLTALSALVAEVGPIEASNRISSGDFVFASKNAMSGGGAVGLARRHLEEIGRCGGRLVVPEDAEWPGERLAPPSEGGRRDRGSGEPLALWVRGPHCLSEFLGKAVAVTGARAASPYGVQVASEFGSDLAANGVTVVAGGAYGIDEAAHRGALTTDGRTVAVLPCGVDVAYPVGNSVLLERISREGLLISEYSPGVVPARQRFLARNRIVAACSDGLVVVEAGRRSGTSYTARITAVLGRVVMAVPGPITSATSVGCLELMRDGRAIPVGSTEDILKALQSRTDGVGGNRTMPASQAVRPEAAS
ncbi:DNA-processing protein DprA [Lentzea albidocapillata]|uniref:DNA-processing protein DprA n=1 Tax=Lentzea albidocapillata TaxID=40571 RepID=UPI00135652A9|nr:DNA-processing protein DprA [Lentzea albidocapillata]